jgi:DNA-binding CsgD family transcriptional regulator/pimeloyl-ACP methyl ester carboxylesterase
MNLPERKPTENEIRAALEDVRRIGSETPASLPLDATANVLIDAARLASGDLERIADALGDGTPAITAVHDAFLACAVLDSGTVLYADAALDGGMVCRSLADIAARTPRSGRLFAVLAMPGGRAPVCVAALGRQATAWLLPPAARAIAAAAPGAVVVQAFIATSLDEVAALLQRAFALTAAEARLGAVLADSPTIKEAARRLSLSPDTVKGRVRDLLSKTGTLRRSALAARLTEFVAGDYTRTQARADLMRDAFGLTRAEARAAAAVADGLTAPEIARAHGVSPHTVRAQIDSALARTGARRGGDLARIVAETCALAAWTSSSESYQGDQRRLLGATRIVVSPVRRRIAAADFGPPAGRPVLHFHPNLCFRWVRRALAEALSERGLRSIGYDRAGCGLSDPAPGLHPFEASARDAASVLAALKIDRVRLFASQGGTAAAIAFAARYPDMVDSAVMLMPRAPSDEPMFPGPIQRIYSGVLSVPGAGERFAEALRRTGSTKFWRWLQAYMLKGVPADAAVARDPAFLQERLAELNASISSGVRGLYEWEQAYKGGWPRPARPGGRSWTIVETAAQPFLAAKSAQDTWGWLPGVRFVKLRDAGRLATHTHAADLADLIAGDAWLGRVRLAG